MFIEEWSDRDALEAHVRRPASAMFRAAVRDLAAETATMTVYEAARAA